VRNGGYAATAAATTATTAAATKHVIQHIVGNVCHASKKPARQQRLRVLCILGQVNAGAAGPHRIPRPCAKKNV
jgi:hypothetical protein